MNDELLNQEENEIIEALQQIKDVPERSQAQISRGKQAFLAEAKEIAGQFEANPVSVSPFRRLINGLTQPKSQMRLSTLTISIILVSILLVTFSGSVYAARNALPDQTLYPYKLWLEERRLALTQQTDSQIDLHLSFAGERLREYQSLDLDPDDPLSMQVFENYQHHVQAANRLLMATGAENGQQNRLNDIQTHYQQLVDPEELEDVDVDRLESQDDGPDDIEAETEIEIEEADDDELSGGDKEGADSVEGHGRNDEDDSEHDDDSASDDKREEDNKESGGDDTSDDEKDSDESDPPDDDESDPSTPEPEETDEPDEEEKEEEEEKP